MGLVKFLHSIEFNLIKFSGGLSWIIVFSLQFTDDFLWFINLFSKTMRFTSTKPNEGLVLAPRWNPSIHMEFNYPITFTVVILSERQARFSF